MLILKLCTLFLIFTTSGLMAALTATDGYHDYNSFVVASAVVGVAVVLWTTINYTASCVKYIGCRYKKVPFEAIAFAVFMFIVGLVL
jgi:hypothetical protein